MSDGMTDRRSQPEPSVLGELSQLIGNRSGGSEVNVSVSFLLRVRRELAAAEMTDNRRDQIAEQAAKEVVRAFMLSDDGPHADGVGEWTVNEIRGFQIGLTAAISKALG